MINVLADRLGVRNFALLALLRTDCCRPGLERGSGELFVTPGAGYALGGHFHLRGAILSRLAV